MKTYTVVPVIKCNNGSDEEKTESRKNMLGYARPFIQEILDQTGGKMLDDARDFGTPGHTDLSQSALRFKASSEAAEQIRQLGLVVFRDDDRVLKKVAGGKGPKL